MENSAMKTHEVAAYETPVLTPATVRFGGQGRTLDSVGNIICSSCSSGID